MISSQPSRTALRVAMRRAAHQMVDAQPLVLDDPFALRILPPENQDEVRYRTPASPQRVYSTALRAFMVARARLAEDTLAQAFAQDGATQYLVLGAGLDTFAWRNPHAGVRVFEVDHPATQAWKRECLHEAKMPAEAVTLVPVDFERDSLTRQLHAAGFDDGAITVTAWLGVTPYLTDEAFRATLQVLAGFAPGSQCVFDYAQPREVLPAREQQMRDSMSARVEQAGEPFLLFRTPATLRDDVEACGLRVLEDLRGSELSARYFTNRSDALALRGEGGRFCRVGSSA